MQLGTAYFNFNQPALGAAATSKAYELREGVSEREKLYIESHYYTMVTGETDKSIEIYRLWQQTYPRDLVPYINLTSIYSNYGQYDKSLSEGLKALRLSGSNARSYGNLANAYMNLNQFDKASQVLSEAKAHKVENSFFPGLRYQLAFLQNDQKEMEREVEGAVGSLGIESWLLALQGDTEAYHGRLAKARECTRRAVAFARHDGDEETALSYAAVGALREAEFGNPQSATKQIAEILAHSRGQQIQILGALALARAGEQEKSLALTRDLHQHFPVDTLLNEYWVPTIQAAVELQRNHLSQAIESLERTRRYELAAPQVATNVLLHPLYLRGSAYLAVGMPSQAQTEFQKILDHPGLVGNYILGSLAHLGLGRAYAMETRIPVVSVSGKPGAEQPLNRAVERLETLAKARAAYQDFFALWKDADPDIPILKQAKAERARLQ
jgi:eukaryotic-like serine/threonine-protein kinase